LPEEWQGLSDHDDNIALRLRGWVRQFRRGLERREKDMVLREPGEGLRPMGLRHAAGQVAGCEAKLLLQPTAQGLPDHDDIAI